MPGNHTTGTRFNESLRELVRNTWLRGERRTEVPRPRRREDGTPPITRTEGDRVSRGEDRARRARQALSETINALVETVKERLEGRGCAVTGTYTRNTRDTWELKIGVRFPVPELPQENPPPVAQNAREEVVTAAPLATFNLDPDQRGTASRTASRPSDGGLQPYRADQITDWISLVTNDYSREGFTSWITNAPEGCVCTLCHAWLNVSLSLRQNLNRVREVLSQRYHQRAARDEWNRRFENCNCDICSLMRGNWEPRSYSWFSPRTAEEE